MRPPLLYRRAIQEKTGYFATWLPNAPLALGDIGVVRQGTFEVETSLQKLGIDFRVRESPGAVAYDHSSQVSQELTAEARAAAGTGEPRAELTLRFADTGGFVFSAQGGRVRLLDDLDRIGREVVLAWRRRAWRREWALVHEVVGVDRATIIVGLSKGSSVRLALDARLREAGATLADAGLGLSLSHQQGEVTSIVAASSLTPLFRARRLHPHLFADPSLDTLREPAPAPGVALLEAVPAELLLRDGDEGA